MLSGRSVFLAACGIFFFVACQGAFATGSSSRFTETLDSAEVLKLKGYYPQAIEVCQQTAAKSQHADDPQAYIRSLLEEADTWRFAYYYSRSPQMLDKAEALLQQARIGLTSLASDHALWIEYYIYKQKFAKDRKVPSAEDSMLHYMNKAKGLAISADLSDVDRARLLYNLMSFNARAGNTKNALYYTDSLVRVLNTKFSNDDYFRGFYLNKVGPLYTQIGDLERSSLCLNLAIDIYEKPEINDLSNLLRAEISLANTLFYADESSNNALLHYRRAVALADKFGTTEQAKKVRALTNMGQVLYRMNKLDSCILVSQLAIRFNKKKNKSDSVNLAFCYRDIGMALLGQNHGKSAIFWLEKSVETIRKVLGSKGMNTYVIYHDIGKAFARHGDFDEALNYYQQSLKALFDDFEDDDVFSNPSFEQKENEEEVMYVLFDKAIALYKQYLNTKEEKYLRASYDLNLRGFALFSNILEGSFMDQSISNIFLEYKEAFDQSIAGAFTLYKLTSDPIVLDHAFSFIEQTRYFLLLKAKKSARIKDIHSISDSLFLAERELTSDIEEIKFKLSDSASISSQEKFEWRNQLLNLMMCKDRVWGSIKKLSGSAMQEVVPQIRSLKEVQRSLIQNNEIIIEYHWGRDQIISLEIGKKFIHFHEIPLTDSLLVQIQIYSGLVSETQKSGDSRRDYQAFIQAAHFLYKRLFEPAAQMASTYFKDENPHIIIVPDGRLSFMPFEALLSKKTTSQNVSYWGLPYLIKDYCIRYAYSLNILQRNLVAKKVNSGMKVLGMSFSSAGESQEGINRRKANNELPFAGKEIAMIKDVMGGDDYYEGEEATEGLFKQKAPQSNILHLALHGKADMNNQYNSRLLFRPMSGSREDGILHAYELYNMDLSNTRLAVLSACETGIGKKLAGEGIFSIARGFAYAGCPAIVMSLWQANDKATSTIMTYFYRNLAERMNKDEALQKAKITYLEQANDLSAHPANWAAFIALGNGEPLLDASFSQFRWYLAIGVFLFIVSVWFIKSHNQRRQHGDKN